MILKYVDAAFVILKYVDAAKLVVKYVDAAKLDVKTGCIDSCFLGRMWDAAGGPYGGVATKIPAKLGGFMALSPNEQCKLLTGAKTPSRKSICGATQHIKPAFLPP